MLEIPRSAKAIAPLLPLQRTVMVSAYRLSPHKKPQSFDWGFGGERWIRTIEVCDNRFTVCSLWPLGNLSTYGAGDGTRTRNLLITNQLLCQLSYTSSSGASEWNRTTDTGIFSPLLYQLSYRGIILATRKRLELSTSSVTG